MMQRLETDAGMRNRVLDVLAILGAITPAPAKPKRKPGRPKTEMAGTTWHAWTELAPMPSWAYTSLAGQRSS
jgi:hypothetical protein